MGYVNATACALVLCSHLTYAEFTLAETSTSSDRRGTIVIMDKDKYQCALLVPEPGKTILYNFTDSKSPCKNDTAREIEFNEIPSATEIVLADSATCYLSGGYFSFKFKTTRKSTTTDYIELEYFKSYHPGAIVKPGLQLINSWVKPGEHPLRDKLSCVQITASPKPPEAVAETSTPPQP
ncbi:hypothetical protein D3C85_1182720 [compost metagenome]